MRDNEAAARQPDDRRLILATLFVIASAVAWDLSGLDLPLARLAGDSAGFALREHWVLSMVLHEGGRRLAWLVALLLVLGVWWPRGPLKRLAMNERVCLAVSPFVAVLAISLLKRVSPTSCPWDLQQFGGAALQLSHWQWLPDGGGGHCFPAGHASAGFSFIGGYFVFRRRQLRLAWAWLAVSLAAGTLLGLSQQWRGAHFMSHTVWSAIVCWCVAWAVHAGWPVRAAAEP